jgi:hypothetical protein
VDTILGILPGENYFGTRVLADIVSMCLHRCQHFVGHISENKWKIRKNQRKSTNQKAHFRNTQTKKMEKAHLHNYLDQSTDMEEV